MAAMRDRIVANFRSWSPDRRLYRTYGLGGRAAGQLPLPRPGTARDAVVKYAQAA